VSRPVSSGLRWWLGPGLIMAGTATGAGDIISATVGGANHGTELLWAIAVGALLKAVLVEGLARWQIATGTTVLEGWATHLAAWVKWYFGLYLVLWTAAVSAALVNACGLGIEHLTAGAIPRTWGGILHSLAGVAIVWVGGFRGFANAMKALVGIMVVSVVLSAALTVQDPAAAAQGLLVPSVPAGGEVYLLSVIGGVGGSISLMFYSYWMREEEMAEPTYLRFVRRDIAVSLALTGVFAVAVMLIANEAFHRTGVQITDQDAVAKMAEFLTRVAGPVGFYVYGIGFWATVFTSLLGVWQGLPYLFVDLLRFVRERPPYPRAISPRTSRSYRLGLLAIALVPLPFVFAERPLLIIILFTVISSFFIPFLAGTLLYLNNRVEWNREVPRNGPLGNLLLVITLALFIFIGSLEVRAAVALLR
jgi:Mn2+/Fe2+ NRAMP family transporter